jgi:hypothetical protein
MPRWSTGEVVLRREVLNDGRSWMEVLAIVVRDEPDLLATYMATGAPFRFPEGARPSANGLNPWAGKERWHGHMACSCFSARTTHMRSGSSGTDRGAEFRGWYVNLQWPFMRTAHGYDTQDLELDIWLPGDGARQWKDDESLAERVREGRFTPEQVDEIRSLGRRIADELDASGRWWDEAWADWEPDPEWPTPSFFPNSHNGHVRGLTPDMA